MGKGRMGGGTLRRYLLACILVLLACTMEGEEVQAQGCVDLVFDAAFACQDARATSTQEVTTCCAAVGLAENGLCFCDPNVESTLGASVLAQLVDTFTNLGCADVTRGNACSTETGSNSQQGAVPATNPSSFPVQEGLEGLWLLQDPVGSVTAIDSSGNGHNGLFEGSVMLREPGRTTATYSAGFDGNDAFVMIPYVAALNSPSFSVSFWANPSTPLPQDSDSSSASTGGPGRTIWPFQSAVESTDIFSGSGYMVTRIGSTGGGSEWAVILGTSDSLGAVALPSGISIVENQWVHVTAVYDNVLRLLRMYVNGRMEGEENLDALLVPRQYMRNERAAMRIGGGSGANFFTGDLQQVAVFNRLLGPAEVQSIYEYGNPDALNPTEIIDNQRTGGASGVSGGPSSSSSDSDSDSNNNLMIIILGVIGGILLLALLVLIILLIRRRKRSSVAGGAITGRKTSGSIVGDDEIRESLRTPLSTSRATHAPTVAQAPPLTPSGDIEETGSAKPRFTRKGSRIHVRFNADQS